MAAVAPKTNKAHDLGTTTQRWGTVYAENVHLDGDLTVLGNSVQLDVATVAVEDPLIKLAKSNATDAVDIGFYGEYVEEATTKYAGVFRDASDAGKFVFFKGLTTEPTSTVPTNGPGYELATIEANIVGQISGVAESANAWSAAMTLNAIGDVTGSVAFDGSSETSITLSLPSSITATTFTGNLTGDVTGNLTGDVTGDVTGNVTGNLTGDVTGDVTGNVTGNLTGDVTGDVTGNVTGNLTGDVTGDVTGNVTGNLTGDVTGDVTGNVTGNLTGDVTGDVTGNVTGNLTGDVTGDVTGNVTGDVTGDVTGNLTGNVTGNVTGNLTGDVTGDVTGNVTGNLTGDVTGDVTGNLTGNVTGDLTGDVTGNVTGNLTGNVLGDVTGNLAGNVTGDLIGDVTGNVTGNLTGNVTGDLTGDVTGNVVGDLTGDVTGNLTGNVTGDVTGNVTGDVTGNVVGNLTGDVTGDVTGNVVGNLTGDVTGDVTGNLTGNVTGDLTGDVTGNLTGNVTGDLTGDVTGNVIGNLTGDVTGDVTGNLTGDVTGDVTGNLTGDVTGNLTGNVAGDVIGDVIGNLTGDVIGNLTGDVTGNLTGNVTGNLTGDVTGDVTGNLTGNVTGNLTGNVTGDLTGNASTASSWFSAMTLDAAGDVTGSVSFTGATASTITLSLVNSSVALKDANSNEVSATLGSEVFFAGTANEVTVVAGGSTLTFGLPSSVSATTFTGALVGNADTSTKLLTAVTISLTGDIVGSALFDGSADISISTAFSGTVSANTINPTNFLINSTLVTATAAELNVLDGITASTAELNLLEGVTASTAELNILDGVTASASEINLLDGSSSSNNTASKAAVLNADKGLDLKGASSVKGSFTVFTTGDDEVFKVTNDVASGTTNVDTVNLRVKDPLVQLNRSTTANVDIGFYGNVTSSTYAGIIFDRSAGKWKVASAMVAPSDNIVTFGDLGDIEVGSIVSSGLTYPTTDGTNGQFLKTDGAGNLSFGDSAGGSFSKAYEVVSSSTVLTAGSETEKFVILIAESSASVNLPALSTVSDGYVTSLRHSANPSGASFSLQVANGSGDTIFNDYGDQSASSLYLTTSSTVTLVVLTVGGTKKWYRI